MNAPNIGFHACLFLFFWPVGDLLADSLVMQLEDPIKVSFSDYSLNAVRRDSSGIFLYHSRNDVHICEIKLLRSNPKMEALFGERSNFPKFEQLGTIWEIVAERNQTFMIGNTAIAFVESGILHVQRSSFRSDPQGRIVRIVVCAEMIEASDELVSALEVMTETDLR